VDCAQDILEELGLDAGIARSMVADDHPLFTHLGYDSVDIETLALRSGLTISELSSILLQLELDGAIATLPGGLYQRIS
jgi:DNA processing protein